MDCTVGATFRTSCCIVWKRLFAFTEFFAWEKREANQEEVSAAAAVPFGAVGPAGERNRDGKEEGLLRQGTPGGPFLL